MQFTILIPIIIKGASAPLARADLDILVWGGGVAHAVADQKDTKIQTPLGVSGGMTPQKIFDIFHALRQLLVRSEADIMPQLVPEILGDKLNLNCIWCLCH